MKKLIVFLCSLVFITSVNAAVSTKVPSALRTCATRASRTFYTNPGANPSCEQIFPDKLRKVLIDLVENIKETKTAQKAYSKFFKKEFEYLNDETCDNATYENNLLLLSNVRSIAGSRISELIENQKTSRNNFIQIYLQEEIQIPNDFMKIARKFRETIIFCNEAAKKNLIYDNTFYFNTYINPVIEEFQKIALKYRLPLINAEPFLLDKNTMNDFRDLQLGMLECKKESSFMYSSFENLLFVYLTV